MPIRRVMLTLAAGVAVFAAGNTPAQEDRSTPPAAPLDDDWRQVLVSHLQPQANTPAFAWEGDLSPAPAGNAAEVADDIKARLLLPAAGAPAGTAPADAIDALVWLLGRQDGSTGNLAQQLLQGTVREWLNSTAARLVNRAGVPLQQAIPEPDLLPAAAGGDVQPRQRLSEPLAASGR